MTVLDGAVLMVGAFSDRTGGHVCEGEDAAIPADRLVDHCVVVLFLGAVTEVYGVLADDLQGVTIVE